MKKFLIVLLTVMFFLTGCGSADSPKNAVESGLKGVKDRNIKLVEKHFTDPEYLTLDYFNGSYIEIIKPLVAQQMKYKVLSSEVKGNEALVEVEIENIDFLPGYKRFVQETNEWGKKNGKALLSEAVENFQRILKDIYSDTNQEKIFTVVEMKLDKIDKEWVIFNSAAVIEAIYPNGAVVFTQLDSK